MIRQPIPRWLALGLGILSVVCLLGGYTWLSHRQHVKNPTDTTIPTWSQLREGTVDAFSPNKRSGERWVLEDAKATGSRLFLGLGLGVVGALVLGLFMGCFTPAEALMQPPMSLMAKIPATAAFAVFFVMVEMGTKLYVTMIAFGVLPTLTLTLYLAVKEFPRELQYKAQTLGASNMEIIISVIGRYILPRFIDAVRLSIGPALVYLIAAEMVVGDVGFGYRIRIESKRLDMSTVYPYLAMLAAFGYLMDYGLLWVQRLCFPWFEKHRG